MKKLFLEKKGVLHYWEAWEHNGTIYEHFGEVGQYGTTNEYPLKEKESIRVKMRELESQLENGYSEREEESQTLVIQFQYDEEEKKQMLEVKDSYVHFFNEVLGWTGNGSCDEATYGNEKLNCHCRVVDEGIALQTLLDELAEQGLLEDVQIAIQDEKSWLSVYPEDASFSLS